MAVEGAFVALADPIRRHIVELLLAGERTAGEIAAQFPVSRPAVSRHLRVLRETGLVRVGGEGQRRLYTLDSGPLEALDGWLGRYRALWTQRLDALDTGLVRGRRSAPNR